MRRTFNPSNTERVFTKDRLPLRRENQRSDRGDDATPPKELESALRKPARECRATDPPIPSKARIAGQADYGSTVADGKAAPPGTSFAARGSEDESRRLRTGERPSGQSFGTGPAQLGSGIGASAGRHSHRAQPERAMPMVTRQARSIPSGVHTPVRVGSAAMSAPFLFSAPHFPARRPNPPLFCPILRPVAPSRRLAEPSRLGFFTLAA